MTRKFCPQCGAPRKEGAQFCVTCGTQYGAEQAAQATQQLQQPTQPQPPAQPQAPQQPAQPQYTQEQYQQQVYAQQQYAHQGPPPKKSSAGKVVGLTFLGCIGVLIVGLAMVFGLALFLPDSTPGGSDGSNSSAAGSVELWNATYDQNRVLSEFGVPQAFIIAYGEDPEADLSAPLERHRVEAWDYWDMGTRFLFKDGNAMGTEELPVPDFEVYTPAFSPLDFSYGMSQSDVSSFMQVDPSATAEVDPDIYEDMVMDSYFDELYASFEFGALMYVEAPLLNAEGGS